MKKSDLIIVRGAGDLATGTIHRLKKRISSAGSGNRSPGSDPKTGGTE